MLTGCESGAGSIFGGKANAQPELEVSAAPDSSEYMRYTVYRKMPMLLGRHERVIATDGAYIHVRPTPLLLPILLC